MKELINRWKSKMPKFWAKVHYVTLSLSGLHLVVLPFLESQTVLDYVHPTLIEVLKYTLTISVTATILSKLTIDQTKQEH
jgi:hypothetical protein